MVVLSCQNPCDKTHNERKPSLHRYNMRLDISKKNFPTTYIGFVIERHPTQLKPLNDAERIGVWCIWLILRHLNRGTTSMVLGYRARLNCGRSWVWSRIESHQRLKNSVFSSFFTKHAIIQQIKWRLDTSQLECVHKGLDKDHLYKY